MTVVGDDAAEMAPNNEDLPHYEVLHLGAHGFGIRNVPNAPPSFS